MGMRRVFLVTLTLLAVLIGTIAIGCKILPKEGEIIDSEYTEFNAVWTQIMEDGSRIPVEVPGRVQNEKGQWVEVVCTLPELPDSRHSLLFRSSQQDIQVFVGDELRTEYTTENTRLFGKSSMSANVIVKLNREDSGKEMIVRTKSVTSYSGFYNVIYYGTDTGVVYGLVNSNLVGILVAYTLLYSGILTFAIGIILRIRYKRAFPMIYAALEAVIAAIQAILESRLRQFYLPNVSLSGFLSYFLIGLIPVVTVLYINRIQNDRYLKIYKPLTIICLISGLINVLLQILDIQDMYRSLGRSYFLFAIAFVVILYTFYKDYKLGILMEIKYPVIGVILTFIAAFGEILITLLKYVTITGLFLNIGMASLLIAAIMESFKQVDMVNQERLKAISDSRAKQAFLANMSHEIRTPINAILGMNEMILRESSEEQIEQYSSNIKLAGDNLLDIINDILDFSKIEFGKLEINSEEYSLSALIRDVNNIISVRADSKDLEFKLDIAEDLPERLCGDEYRVRQVMLNLLNNAVKYTDDGLVTFRISGEMADNAENGFRLHIEVEDTGRGIKEEDMLKIFDSFERIDVAKNKNIEGTGLGLAITRNIVNMMQGEIDVKSEYGKGSVFYVDIVQGYVSDDKINYSLLLSRGDASIREKYKESFRAPDAKILVVDDYSINLTVIRGLLKKTQVQIFEASNGRECIEMCRNDRFDLILMDHMMPELDGVEVLNILRDEHEDLCPVIILTANAIKGSKEKYMELGFADYISKPVNPTELEMTIRKHLKNV